MAELHNKPWKIAIALLCGLTILWEAMLRLGLAHGIEIYQILLWADCLCAGVVIGRLNFRKQKWMLPQLLFFPAVILLNCIQGFGAISGEAASLLRAVYLFCIVGLLGTVLQANEMKTWLKWFAAAWTIYYFTLALIGLYASFTGTQVANLSGTAFAEIGESSSRLSIFCYYTVISQELCLAILIALISIVLYDHFLVKLCFGLMVIPMIIAMSLTDGRGGIICLGGGIGVFAAEALFYCWQWRGKKLRKFTRSLLLLMVTAISTLVVYCAVTSLVPVINHVVESDYQLSVIAESHAEEEPILTDTEEIEEEEVSQKNLAAHRSNQEDFFTGRTSIWKAGLWILRENPSVLLFGASIPQVDQLFAQYQFVSDYPFQHMHCLALQILMELGIAGLALFIAFLIIFATAAVRLLLSDEKPLWMKLMPIPAICVLVGEMVECVTKLSYRYPSAAILMLFAGMTMAFAFSDKTSRTAEQQ